MRDSSWRLVSEHPFPEGRIDVVGHMNNMQTFTTLTGVRVPGCALTDGGIGWVNPFSGEVCLLDRSVFVPTHWMPAAPLPRGVVPGSITDEMREVSSAIEHGQELAIVEFDSRYARPYRVFRVRSAARTMIGQFKTIEAAHKRVDEFCAAWRKSELQSE